MDGRPAEVWLGGVGRGQEYDLAGSREDFALAGLCLMLAILRASGILHTSSLLPDIPSNCVVGVGNPMFQEN